MGIDRRYAPAGGDWQCMDPCSGHDYRGSIQHAFIGFFGDVFWFGCRLWTALRLGRARGLHQN